MSLFIYFSIYETYCTLSTMTDAYIYCIIPFDRGRNGKAHKSRGIYGL